MPDLLAMVDDLSRRLLDARLSVIHEFSGSTRRDSLALLAELNAQRALAGLAALDLPEHLQFYHDSDWHA